MPEILIPRRKHQIYNKWATDIELSSLDKKFLAEQAEGYYVIKVIDVWKDADEKITHVECKIVSRKRIQRKKINAPNLEAPKS